MVFLRLHIGLIKVKIVPNQIVSQLKICDCSIGRELITKPEKRITKNVKITTFDMPLACVPIFLHVVTLYD